MIFFESWNKLNNLKSDILICFSLIGDVASSLFEGFC